MRILVTGGAGFIGSHLAEALLARGDEVRILDDLSTGSRSNLDLARRNRRCGFVEGSVFDEKLLRGLVRRSDAVVHLAAAVGVLLVVERPVEAIATNVGGTELLLRLAAERRTPVLLASSSEVYGKSAKVPFREDGDSVLGASTKGRWSYAASKLLDEFLALAYWREKRLPTVVLRLFNTVGPRQTGRYGMVLPRFVEQGLRGGPITVYGDGRQSRCFGHVSDVVAGIVALLGERRACGEVFNVGNDEEITIGALARLVRRKTDPGAEIVKVPYAEAYAEGFEDLRRRVPDLRKLKRLTGWRPRLGLERIVDDVVAAARG